MTTIKNALVIGGGFAGMSAAIQLRKIGVSVDLAEKDPEWTVLGAGITLAAQTMRAFETIGVDQQVAETGFVAGDLDLFDSAENLITTIPTPKPVGSDYSGSGILRPDLARILAEKMTQEGVQVFLGKCYESFREDETGVTVTFSDGDVRQYDLVIAADGVHSTIRQKLFPDAPQPEYLQQVCWRAVLDRPKHIVRPTFWMGPVGKVGVNPISDAKMYMFINEHRPDQERIERSQWAETMKAFLAPFSAPTLQALMPQFDEDIHLDYRPLHNLLLPRPWYRGRIVLIGDAVHATTPHLASGACIGVESAIVLAEELERHSSVAEALNAFETRRWDRCRLVVENSERLLRIENGEGDKAEHGKLIGMSMHALAQPI